MENGNLEAVESVEQSPAEGTEAQNEQQAEETKSDGAQATEQKPVEPKKENHDSRRWTKLVRERAEYKAKAELYEKVLSEKQGNGDTATKKPTLSQFDGDVEQYTDALTDYKLALAGKKSSDSPANRSDNGERSWRAKEASAKSNYPDYDDVVYDSDPLQLPGGAIEAIMTSDVGADIRYLLAKEPELAEKLETLSESAAIREIGKIEARIEASKKSQSEKKPVEKKLPNPIKPEKGGSGATDGDLSAETLFQKFSRREKINT